MKDRKIGQIILNGGSIIEIRKEFPDFPENPTKEYLIQRSSLIRVPSTLNKYFIITDSPHINTPTNTIANNNHLPSELCMASIISLMLRSLNKK